MKHLVFSLLVCCSVLRVSAQTAHPQTALLPLGGNGWVDKGAAARIGNKGLTSWSDKNDVVRIWFRTESGGDLDLALKLRVPEGQSRISLTVAGKTLTKNIANKEFQTVSLGKVRLKGPGYVKAEIRGISKSGGVFAEVSDLELSGEAIGKGLTYVKNNEGNYFYWGHRGPSVHLQYVIPEAAADQVEWFYSEINVPQGEDKQGTYYMANGFSGGYFGMQVNSPTERRVLFSIWSPFQTDDPKSIPDSMKIHMLKKGSTTRTGEFGNEGSGGQSYMRYAWEAGKTYAFLVRAQADQQHRTTTFTAYFKDLQKGDWQLVASFKRPKSGGYLKGLYSFLENFDPATGEQHRKGNYGNQWAVDTKGNWYEVTKARFTADATANMNYRKDYGGGTSDQVFFLRNCGFFSDFTPVKTLLERKSTGKSHPAIDFSKLP
ncbi:nematoblast specific protein [Pedobacter yulinensis]|uniref:Nematoblast specific protein n=1 Tax=Pedobacter yulinensis TaxID=2126353 RepID=A0A2T3HNJ9_9SPHI|nr:DUF3472 domain-containing protein [Pedobacter yulinensis]PST83973.1 nematoblast specific protein [Pedobacter yulinensis]